MAIEILTYDDCVQHLVDVFQFKDATRIKRIARMAIDNAYRDMPSIGAGWRYFERRTSFLTSAQQTSSTIVYDHTGGTNEREITIAAGTWPTWARYGRIIIAGNHYRIARRISATVLTLPEDDNPGADVAAGTSYTLYRAAYPMPDNFRQLVHIIDTAQDREVSMVGLSEEHRTSAYVWETPDTPYVAHLRNVDDSLGVISVVFSPPPSTARRYDLTYKAKPRDIRTVSHRLGTVATSSTTVTGTSTSFPATCAGSVIRFGTSASGNAVTNKYGDNPFTQEIPIVARNSATELILEYAPDTTYSSGTAYQISDPIDLMPGPMQTAFLRMCESEYARLTGLKDRNEREMATRNALILAREADSMEAYANAAWYWSATDDGTVSTA